MAKITVGDVLRQLAEYPPEHEFLVMVPRPLGEMLNEIGEWNLEIKPGDEHDTVAMSIWLEVDEIDASEPA